MTRRLLPFRRDGLTVEVTFRSPSGTEQTFIVTYGFDRSAVMECFCSSPKGDMQAFINDSCIAMSLLLQHGMTMIQLAEAFGEDRPEGMRSGPPSSPLGAIARTGALIERERMAKEAQPCP